jgi:hypothetical protein
MPMDFVRYANGLCAICQGTYATVGEIEAKSKQKLPNLENQFLLTSMDVLLYGL